MKKFEGSTLGQAKAFVHDNWSEGVRCPCCSKHVQLYRTRLNAPMARALLLINGAPAQAYENGWLHVENYFVHIDITIKGVHGKLKHWKLLEQKENNDEPEKNKSGYWRMTDLGRDFAEGKVTVHEAVYLYLDKVRGRDEVAISIKQALGVKFDYDELMRGEFYGEGHSDYLKRAGYE